MKGSIIMNFTAAKRLNAIDSPSFSELFEAKKQYTGKTGQEVIDFSIGSSNIPPHESVKKALADAALSDQSYQYSLSALPETAEAVQKWYKNRYGVELASDELVTLKGSQEALSHIPMAFCDPGDLVLIPDPYYPIYGTAPKLAGADIFFMPSKKKTAISSISKPFRMKWPEKRSSCTFRIRTIRPEKRHPTAFMNS